MCGHKKLFKNNKGYYECKKCGYEMPTTKRKVVHKGKNSSWGY